MNLNSTVLNNASGEATAAERVLKVALAALKRGDFLEVVKHLSREFTFSDYALDLEFKDKQELITFFSRTCELFPNTERTDNIILSIADHVVSQWTLTGTGAQPFFLGGRTIHVPIHARGVSIVQIENGKICHWAEYYDQIKSRRYSVAAMFTDWDADCC
jgi:limonene-1,2-epoxide hydrolase